MYANTSVDILKPLNSDEGICDAARVSFAKTADSFTREENAKLLKYLWKHKHWSPFGHARETFHIECWHEELTFFFQFANHAGFTWARTITGAWLVQGSLWAWYENLSFFQPNTAAYIREALRCHYPLCVPMFKSMTPHDGNRVQHQNEIRDIELYADLQTVSFRIVAPIFVARQLVKHQIGLCWNEESRRYIDSLPMFYEVDEFRKRPDGSIKQGSSENKLTDLVQRAVKDEYSNTVSYAYHSYNRMIDSGVAPEQARALLPVSAMTQWIWTGSVAAFKRVCNLRLDPHAQQETREVAVKIDSLIRSVYPETWRELDASTEKELG